MMTLAIVVALASAAPDGEALALGRQVAESGTLAWLLPVMGEKETEDLVAAHPELSASDKEALRATASLVYAAGKERLIAAEARALAERMSVEDLRAIAAYQQSPAARRYRAAAPEIVAATMRSVGELDFKKEVRAAFCKQTGKLCDAK